MMTPADLPPRVGSLAESLVGELTNALGANFVGLFCYGAACFPPSPVSDFDGHVVVAEPFTDEDRTRVWGVVEKLRSLPLGDELDVWYVTSDALGSRDFPQTELKPGFLDRSWALHRAHVHAGRYVVVAGPDPRPIVREPTWQELDEALQGELDYVRDHLEEGEALAYCVLNLCRILSSYTNLDVVTSKYHSALWTLGALPSEHHELIRLALGTYATGDRDPRLAEGLQEFAGEMEKRIRLARELSSLPR